MFPENPLISIIMPVYNREQFVAKAIESVLSQNYRQWEFLIVDDGSTDKTPDILKSYADRLVILRQENQGPYAARNLALSRVKGDLVAFLDSDDEWYPRRLMDQVPLFQQDDVGLVYSDGIFVKHHAGTRRRLLLSHFSLWPPHRGQVFQPLLRCNFIPQSSVLVRRKCLEETGPFSLTGPLGSDYAKWVQVAMRYKMDYIAEPLFDLGIHSTNISRDSTLSHYSLITLFEELLNQTSDEKTRELLCRKLVDLRVNLIRASAFRGWRSLQRAISTPADARCRVSMGRSLIWIAVSMYDQLRLGILLLIQRIVRLTNSS